MEGFDHLSSLPLELRFKLLSLASTQSAVQTCVLSQEWEHSWNFISSIRLDDDDAPLDFAQVSVFFGHVMAAVDTIEGFHLHISHFWFPPPTQWIHDAIAHHITELDLAVHTLELPPSFFTCQTLKKLKLRLTLWVMQDWEQPAWGQNLEIRLPNLVSFDTSAHDMVYQNMFQIIRGSPALKTVSFSGCGYIPLDAPLPKSLNINTLEFNDTIDHGLVAVFHMLDSCPSLEHLSIGRLQQSDWCKDIRPPSCMVKSLKTIKLTHYDGLECDREFVEYLMANAEKLKKLEITLADDLPSHQEVLHEELVLLPKASDDCEIWFCE